MPSDAPLPARQEALTRPEERALTAEAFHQLADVPPAMEWFANIDNPQTRRAYENDLKDFMGYVRNTCNRFLRRSYLYFKYNKNKILCSNSAFG